MTIYDCSIVYGSHKLSQPSINQFSLEKLSVTVHENCLLFESCTWMIFFTSVVSQILKCLKPPKQCKIISNKSCSYPAAFSLGGWVRQKCHVPYVRGASSWYWLTVGQGLLSLQQVRVEEECFYFFCFFTVIYFPFSPVPLFHLLYCLFSLSLGDDTKCPTRVNMSLNPNTI